MNENDYQMLKNEINSLKDELSKRENNFSEKRAQFKDLYIKKEKELEKMKSRNNELIVELRDVKRELIDIQSAAALSESIRKEELDSMKNKYNEKISLINGIMKHNIDSINKSKQELENRIKESEIEKVNIMKKLDEKNTELTNSNENVLVKIAHRLKLSTHDIFKGFQENNSDDNYSSGIVTNDTDVLKSLVQPYEEDAIILKTKIREAYDRIDKLEAEAVLKQSIDIDTLQTKIVELENKLQTEVENNECLNKTFTEINNKYMETEDKLMRLEKLDQQRPQQQQQQLCDGCQKPIKSMESGNCQEPAKVGLRKSLSGNDITESQDEDAVMVNCGLRRNTDVQSLIEYGSRSSRVIGENEWSRLQLELATLKNRSGLNCEMCKNYEDQLQAIETRLTEKEKCFKELSIENQSNLRVIASLQESSNKLSCCINNDVAEHEKTIQNLTERLNFLNDLCDSLRSTHERLRDTSDKELKQVTHERREMKMKIEKIELAYDNLLCKRIKKAREMEAEAIELPTDMESAQFVLLSLREDLIECRAANEHLLDTVHSTEIFNKEREKADKAEKDAFVNEYNNERKEFESQIEKLQIELNKRKIGIKSSENLEEQNKTLKMELDSVRKALSSLENESKSLKSKSQALQQELENSESVQQDFVRLSQTLQIQLEKIRQEENELRWQFEEDISHCNDCQNDLSVVCDRKKYHCKHCGRIFCKNCLVEITAGSKSKKADICKVCHTLLVKEAVPYFSNNRS